MSGRMSGLAEVPVPVVVLTGRPCSGKSTELERRAGELRAVGREPIVIDYDALAVCFGSRAPTGHGHAQHFTVLAQRTRGLAISLALQAAREHGCDVLIVDSSPPQSRRDAYAAAAATTVLLDTPVDECHRRADTAGRPAEWHDLIDTWAPEQEQAGWAWTTTQRKRWPQRPGYRKAAHGRRYERLRGIFLADKTNCAHCGVPFVTDAPCSHPRCLKRGKGCYLHPHYPTVQHLVHLVDGGPSLDMSTWEAWAAVCNQADGARVGNARRARRNDPTATHGAEVDLDW